MINLDVIFQDPLTLINKIVPDLLPIIKEYHRTFPEFIIGPYSAEYDDYRPIEQKDFHNLSFVESFSNFYKENKGFPALENFSGNVLYCLDGVLLLSYYPLRLIASYNNKATIPITKGNIYSFITFNVSENELMESIHKVHGSVFCYGFDTNVAIKLFKYDN